MMTIAHRGSIFTTMADAVNHHNRTERIMTETPPNQTPDHRHATEPELADLLATEHTDKETVLTVLDGLRDFGVALESLVTVRVDDDDNPVCVEQPVNPQTPGTITGYREQTPAAVDAVNAVKNIENTLGEFIAVLKAGGEGGGLLVDPRWLSIGVTHLQQGFMAVNRAIFQPESRLKP